MQADEEGLESGEHLFYARFPPSSLPPSRGTNTTPCKLWGQEEHMQQELRQALHKPHFLGIFTHKMGGWVSPGQHSEGHHLKWTGNTWPQKGRPPLGATPSSQSTNRPWAAGATNFLKRSQKYRFFWKTSSSLNVGNEFKSHSNIMRARFRS